MIEIKVPVFTKLRYLVSDEDGALRMFHTEEEAKQFVGDRQNCIISKVITWPQKRSVTFDESPF